MTLLDASVIAFVVLNAARVIAYLPQFFQIYRDPHGAAAVSISTWTMFSCANAATVSRAGA